MESASPMVNICEYFTMGAGMSSTADCLPDETYDWAAGNYYETPIIDSSNYPKISEITENTRFNRSDVRFWKLIKSIQ